MNRIALAVLASLITNSCTYNSEKNEANRCEIDYEFKSNFLNCIQLITLRQTGYRVSAPKIEKKERGANFVHGT
ncbi:hypothetical protein GXP67_13490 [Rhodocytophaga rosea]|uniref:Uncharacterized protein n=1 Tax=Rhodocytophaga rosea TaxID=2704465 RepID=A0A6C0GHY5_9BACT|nr:hypothetical protein [Rhodocytophaga rosea]QHT67569.1 hypothetical protein GXP67_13490 [Rhodocytophaga rosea]